MQDYLTVLDIWKVQSSNKKSDFRKIVLTRKVLYGYKNY